MQTPFCGGSAEGLNLNETMMPEYFNSVGYTSQIVGKCESLPPIARPPPPACQVPPPVQTLPHPQPEVHVSALVRVCLTTPEKWCFHYFNSS